ncbi:lipolytic protein, partial [Burkholderia sp. TJI49]
MPLDPQAQALLAAFAQAPAIDFDRLTVPAYRASLAAGGAFAPGDTIAAEEDWQIPASGRQLSARL